MAALTVSGSPTFNAGPPTSCTIDSTGSDRVQAPVTGLAPAQGWWAVRMKMNYASTVAQDLFVADWRDDASNFIRFGWHGAATGAGWVSGRKAAGAGSDGSWIGDTFASGDKRTVIMRWTATVWGQSLNGAAFSDLANTNIPTLAATLFDIGSSAAASQIGSDVIWFAWGSGTLTDANASTINGFGDTDTAPGAFPGTCLGVWYAVDATYDDGAGALQAPAEYPARRFGPF